DMTLQLTGASRQYLAGIWRGKPETGDEFSRRKPAAITREQIEQFCFGKPSLCFGDEFRVFDEGRFLARLPSPPYLFLDRMTEVQATPHKFAPGAWVEAEYDVTPDAWYFRANRQNDMPYSVLLEFGLQACGWLSAFLGSAMRSEGDLHYRNLDGRATLHRTVNRDSGTLTTRATLTSDSQSGGMIIQRFEVRIWDRDGLIFECETAFGFFSKQALAQQVGVRGANPYNPTDAEAGRMNRIQFPDESPLTPGDPNATPAPDLALPAKAYKMIDEIEWYPAPAGPHRMGFVRGRKRVNPDEWFFKAHFYGDPVNPGSLGLEAFLQLLKAVALDRWGAEISTTHRFTPIPLGVEHTWSYRGQVIPANAEVVVDAAIKEISEEDHRIIADGYLKVDGKIIYEMKNFGMQAVPSGGGSA
ncbi:type I polyketide synthase, partial [Candidatus Sumerlaeota bacterium]|nr:type I polyketide synthase [Candidatus Sumerlaeota bacterium]